MNNEFLLFKSSLVEIRITSLFCMYSIALQRTSIPKNHQDGITEEP